MKKSHKDWLEHQLRIDKKVDDALQALGTRNRHKDIKLMVSNETLEAFHKTLIKSYQRFKSITSKDFILSDSAKLNE